jgi:AmmeMemoRadiSam system protein A
MNTNPYVTLALNAIKHYLTLGQYLQPPNPLPEELQTRSGAFVSLKKNHALRGCIGTIVPVQDNLAKEIIRNAISAAVEDPRFDPVTEDELPDLTLSVDVLTPLEKVEGTADLDCKKYGLVVRHGNKQGVLLPDITGVDTVEEQIRICRKKAGLGNKEAVEYFRFEVTRYK